MSKPRYDWWPYVKGMIRRYPALKEEFLELHEQTIVASYSDTPRAGGQGRPLEALVIRELPKTQQREYEAVRCAVETTGRYQNGRERLAVIEMVLWKQSHTVAGAALRIPCHEDTAKVWHGEFIRMVASYYGLLDT